MSRTRTFPLVLAVALLACALAPSSALAISRETVLARGRVWLKAVRVDPVTKKVTVGVPYSQSKWALENGSVPPTSTPYAGYRTDCSGFASLCWNLKNSSGKPYSTSTYEMGKNNSPYFKLTAIRQSELQPGDLILKSTVWYTGSGGGHAIIFAGWSKSDMSEYWALEQTSPGTKYSRRPYGQTGYRAVPLQRRRGFQPHSRHLRWHVHGGRNRLQDSRCCGLRGCHGRRGRSRTLRERRLGRARGLECSRRCQRPLLGHLRAEDDRALRGSLPECGHVSTRRTCSPQPRSPWRPALSGVSGNSSKLRRKRTYVFSGTVNPARRLQAVGLQVRQEDASVSPLQDRRRPR